MNKLLDWTQSLNRTPVIPLVGYPATRLTNTSIKLNEFNWGVHAWTLQTLWRRFKPDAVFVLMDLAVEASGMGLQVRFPLYESPSVEIHPVEEKADLDQFKAVDVLKDGRVYSFIQTVELLDDVLPDDVLSGAYCTGPFTLAGLLTGANDIAMNVLLKPEEVQRVLDLATSVITRYSLALEQAGADIIMMLDPLATILSPDHFEEFAGRYASIVNSSIHDAMRVYHVCGNTDHLIEQFADVGAEGLSLDADIDLPDAARRLPEDIVLMGNVDPTQVVVRQEPEGVRNAVDTLQENMSEFDNWILSTGCDLPLETPLANIAAFMQAGKPAEAIEMPAQSGS